MMLNFNHRVLYSPSDFQDERHFLETLTGAYSGGTNDTDILRGYWKPDGSVTKQSERRLKEWLKSKGLEPDTITLFLRNELLADARRRAIVDLELLERGW